MKRLFLALLMATLAITTFQSCKKGPNDPAISCKSRDARLMTTWKLTKIEASDVTVISGVTNTITTTYDGATITSSSTLSGSETSTGTYEMTIEKGGVMTWSESYTPSGASTANVQSATGTWFWFNSNKNKYMIDLSGGVHFLSFGIYYIDRLATKELILINSGEEYNNGDTRVWNFKWTFEKK